MIAAVTPRKEKLSPAQKRIWPHLRSSVALGFVLYGGTAISLQLGHRRSVDFDFFHDKPLDKAAIGAGFEIMKWADTLQESVNTLVVSVSGRRRANREPVKVSFLGDMRFGRIGDPCLTADGVMELASLDDLLAHKLKVILHRAEKKDYQDIAALIRAGCTLEKGLAAARLFFRKSFQPAASLKALTYFKEEDLPRLAAADKAVLIAAASAVRRLPAARHRSKTLAISVAS